MTVISPVPDTASKDTYDDNIESAILKREVDAGHDVAVSGVVREGYESTTELGKNLGRVAQGVPVAAGTHHHADHGGAAQGSLQWLESFEL